MSMVIEWAPYRLAPDVSDDELLRESDVLEEEFLRKQPGYVRRELLRQEEGRWCDLLYWENAAAAEQAMQQALNSEVCMRYFRLMTGLTGADPGADLQHFTVARSYAAISG